MLEQCAFLTPPGYPGPKPDILYRMERGEEPWVCSPQSPARWEGPSCPSPGEQEQLRPCSTTPACRQQTGLPPLPSSCSVEGFPCQEGDIHLSGFPAGCDGAMSLLEAPPWGWWPGAGVPEERAQLPCQGEFWSLLYLATGLWSKELAAGSGCAWSVPLVLLQPHGKGLIRQSSHAEAGEAEPGWP